MEKRDFERLASFRHQLRCFLRRSEDLCQAADLTPLQYLLLLQVAGMPGRDWATVGELAERLQAKHHGVVALVDRCEKLQLVERRPGREDRRRVEIHLLPAGRAQVRRIALQHKPELRMLRAALDALEHVDTD